ncbi:MAG TPA: hypothetical protein VE970_05890 [Pseudolabrys sp.]|nr:hypothetical protein [Pseudolabrys sp.]
MSALLPKADIGGAVRGGVLPSSSSMKSDESRLALHGGSMALHGGNSGGAAMIASKSDHICGEIGGGSLDDPRWQLARRPPSAIGLGPLEEHD